MPMVPAAVPPGNRPPAAYNRPDPTADHPPGRSAMDKKTMMQVLLPAAAAAGVVLLVGVLIALGDGAAVPATGDKAGAADTGAVAADTSGTTLTLPPVDAPEWKPGPGGMKVWDVAEGTGDVVQPGANLHCHYTGWLKDGTIFDSSVKRNQPADFGLNEVIRGWTEGLPGMKVGGVRRLYIPADWAYGAAGRPGIPANSDLVFEVKLLRINN